MNILDLKNKTFEKKDELIKAALKEFSEKDYQNASLNNILKESTISKGAFYHHFKNKEELYLFIISIIADKKLVFFQENYNYDPNKDYFETLTDLIEVSMKFIYENPQISKLSENFIKNKDSVVFRKIYGESGNEIKNDYLVQITKEAYDNKQISNNFPIEFIQNMVNYLFVHLLDFTQIMNTQEYGVAAKYLVQFLKNGLSSNSIE